MSKSKSDILPDDERLAWKFLPYGTRRGEPITDPGVPIVIPGQTYRAADWEEMREGYLYTSDSAISALRDSTGLFVCRVRLCAPIYLRRRRTGKLYATSYEILWEGDPTGLLNAYACDIAEQALQREALIGRLPDAFLLDVVKARREWLDGKLSDDDFIAIEEAVREYRRQEIMQALMTPPVRVTIGGAPGEMPLGYSLALAKLVLHFASSAGTPKQMLFCVWMLGQTQNHAPMPDGYTAIDRWRMDHEVEDLLTDHFAPRLAEER